MTERKTKYYEAIETADGFRARIYQYKDDGNRIEVIWLSSEEYTSDPVPFPRSRTT